MNPYELAEIKLLADDLRAIVGDDGETLLDTLDGETSLMDMIGATLRQIDEATAAATGSAERRDHYAERVKAMKDRIDRLRGVLARIIDATGEKTIRHDLATISLRMGKPSLIIADDTNLPDDLVKIIRRPDAAAIRERLEAGDEVDGAFLGNAAPVVTIRSK